MRKYGLAEVCKFMKDTVVLSILENIKITDKFRYRLTDDALKKESTFFVNFYIPF